ncbi:MAG TPA: hypothetical protein VGU64_20525, partial [Terriglobales bacterium]|nr:hypothetical protein [Terriglobales bacterium]
CSLRQEDRHVSIQHDSRGADDKNFAWVSMAMQAASRCRLRKVTETSLLSEFKGAEGKRHETY